MTARWWSITGIISHQASHDRHVFAVYIHVEVYICGCVRPADCVCACVSVCMLGFASVCARVVVRISWASDCVNTIAPGMCIQACMRILAHVHKRGPPNTNTALLLFVHPYRRIYRVAYVQARKVTGFTAPPLPPLARTMRFRVESKQISGQASAPFRCNGPPVSSEALGSL